VIRWMLVLAAAPIVLRLLLVPGHPIPEPAVSDDFSYVLQADTLRHFRLANPPHALPQFFETFFVLQEPTYSSIFPLGQGIAIAVGWVLFGHPWAGVALSIGALCALCYWMLRAWTTPGWALAGGILAVFLFGPLSQWTNSFWGGAVSGCAGCLVFGALPRLRESGRLRDALLLGTGLGLQILTRPFESVLLVLCVLLWLPRKAAPSLLVVAAALGLTAIHNRAVTGSWLTMPYQLSRQQYGVPTTFTFQPLPVPERPLTREQQLDYRIQSQMHDKLGFGARLADRLRWYRFYFLPPLLLAIPFFLLRLREHRFAWVAAAILVFVLGTNFYPYFYTHYVAAVACLFLLVSVAGLERLSRIRPQAAHAIIALCVAHFAFWYGLHLFGGQNTSLARYETGTAINYGDPEGRIEIRRRLLEAPGKHLVFVRYGPLHTFKEWVHNPADIDAARIVWARDLGQENGKLRRYYPDRDVWVVEPDAQPPRLLRVQE
jgi:hypothetical protein